MSPSSATEWRTAPLSSIGFLTTVGANANLPSADREAVVAFVNSL